MVKNPVSARTWETQAEPVIYMSKFRWKAFLSVIIAGAGAVCAPAFALEPSNVLVVYNTNPDSGGPEIASYYSQIHPGVQMLGLANLSTSENISADDYLSKIRTPVAAALTDSIQCIVTTKGLPLRINNPKPDGWKGPWWEYSSLESELTKAETITNVMDMGIPWQSNPYYQVKAPFDHTAHGMRLTSRLDGYTVDEVKGAIDRAQRARIDIPNSYFHIDDDPNAPGSSADQMEDLNTLLTDPARDPQLNVTYDATNAFVNVSEGNSVIAYVSHGRYGGAPEGYLLDEVNGLQFALDDGAVMHTWESYNAYTFTEGGPNPCGHGLVAQWIRRGGTAATGNVEEPSVTVFTVPNEDLLFDMLLDGYTWGEAAWSATAQTSYVNTIVGDPLMVFREWVPGDATGDGVVNICDLGQLAMNYGMSEGATVWNGDFNGDGSVRVGDLGILSANYGTGTGGAGVPEPATLALLGMGAIAVLCKRRGAR